VGSATALRWRTRFDKLLATPIRRSSIIFGRLAADFVRGALGATVVLLAGIAFGAHMESGILGAVVLVLLSALFGVGFAILIALARATSRRRTRACPCSSRCSS